ncbi:AAA family ATPase [Streptomyces sp. NPDC020917]|uniref:helix-turn-helix transcriptional regulator n=1 Tax=Streptomyces sp. NPDC020917 TaxID=3365102 RepID=UPI003798D6E7
MGRVPANGKHGANAAPDFVGRDDELAAIVGAVTEGPALVLVEGEPGIGKTRLVRRALDELPGRTVLVCTSPPLREPFPLGPIAGGLRRLCADRLPDGLSPMAGALRPLFPEWSELLPAALEPLPTAGETRHRVFRALVELLDRLRVSVLVLEDAHWADTATLELLLTLVAAGGHSRSLVVTYRPAEIDPVSPLLRLTSWAPAGLHRLRVGLGPLTVDQTGRLIGSMFGADHVSTEFATFLRQHTDGVPLAVEECVRLLTDRRDIVRQDGQWTRRVLDGLEVPATVRDSVRERLARLRPEGRVVLEAAAVLGVPAGAVLLGDVAGLDGAASLGGVEVALSSGLLQETEPGRFAFRHALDAQAVGDSVPALRRRQLHAAATAAYERREPDALDRLTRHSREAGDTEAWCRYAEAATDVALASGDDRNAVTLLLQLLAGPQYPVERRQRYATRLGEAVFYGSAALGDIADEVIEAIHQVLDDPRASRGNRGELRLLLGRMLWRAGRQRAAFGEFEAAIADLGDRPDLAGLMMCNLALPLVPDWPAERHLGWLDRAAELVEPTGSGELAVAVGTARASTLLLLGHASAWASVAALDRPHPAGARELTLHATGLLNVAGASLSWGRYEETRRLLHAAAEFIPDAEHHRVAEGFRIIEATLCWYTGRWDGLAAELARPAGADTTETHDRLFARLIEGVLRLVTAPGPDAERALRELTGQLFELGITEPTVLLPFAVLGRAALGEGDPERAVAWLAPAAELVAGKDVWLWYTDLAAVHVEALARAGSRAAAESFAGRFAAALDRRDAPAPAAALPACRAVLAETAGDTAAAAEDYRAAAAAWAALPRPYDRLLALEGAGRCLVAGGSTADGIELLGQAQAGLGELGARRDADRVARLLRRYGADVARTWRHGQRGYGKELSPREREVLAFVARGMTNREVGEALFLSPRTVGRHLGSAMRKLQVTTRTAAAIAAAEAGLLGPSGAAT